MNNPKLTITPKPPRGEDGYKTFSVRVKEDLIAEIEEISSKTGRTRNELIGTFLEFALKNYEIVSGE